MKRLLRAIRRMLRSRPRRAPITDADIRRETARATSDMYNKQGGF